MGHLVVCDHPLIQHKLASIRDKRTSTPIFRALVEEVALLMAVELTRELPLTEATVETPVATAKVRLLDGHPPVLVPILRAGLGMTEGVRQLLPAAAIGHIGLYRDPQTLQPVEYYVKLPTDAAQRELIVIDPMLATGGSASAAIRLLQQRGCTRIRLLGLIAAPEGIAALQTAHPDVDIYVAAVDERLNEHGYIVPGLGDAGDRLFGTDESGEASEP